MNPENCCISYRRKLLGLTNKEPPSNFEPRKYLKYKQLWGPKPDLDAYIKGSLDEKLTREIPLNFTLSKIFEENWFSVECICFEGICFVLAAYFKTSFLSSSFRKKYLVIITFDKINCGRLLKNKFINFVRQKKHSHPHF